MKCSFEMGAMIAEMAMIKGDDGKLGMRGRIPQGVGEQQELSENTVVLCTAHLSLISCVNPVQWARTRMVRGGNRATFETNYALLCS